MSDFELLWLVFFKPFFLYFFFMQRYKCGRSPGLMKSTAWSTQMGVISCTCTFVHGRQLCAQLINGSPLVPLLWPAGSEISPSTFSFNFSLSAFGRVAIVFAFGKMLKLMSHVGVRWCERGEMNFCVCFYAGNCVCPPHWVQMMDIPPPWENMALQDWRSRSNKERKLTMTLL